MKPPGTTHWIALLLTAVVLGCGGQTDSDSDGSAGTSGRWEEGKCLDRLVPCDSDMQCCEGWCAGPNNGCRDCKMGGTVVKSYDECCAGQWDPPTRTCWCSEYGQYCQKDSDCCDGRRCNFPFCATNRDDW